MRGGCRIRGAAACDKPLRYSPPAPNQTPSPHAPASLAAAAAAPLAKVEAAAVARQTFVVLGVGADDAAVGADAAAVEARHFVDADTVDAAADDDDAAAAEDADHDDDVDDYDCADDDDGDDDDADDVLAKIF